MFVFFTLYRLFLLKASHDLILRQALQVKHPTRPARIRAGEYVASNVGPFEGAVIYRRKEGPDSRHLRPVTCDVITEARRSCVYRIVRHPLTPYSGLINYRVSVTIQGRETVRRAVRPPPTCGRQFWRRYNHHVGRRATCETVGRLVLRKARVTHNFGRWAVQKAASFERRMRGRVIVLAYEDRHSIACRSQQ
ncbi:hypothetical protein EVAR_47657_1 [Eumeta japonica]|uniref:Secreted protein n=1 Tax=Eumeta variegata TaxID=151549 RepID=A0A4C1XXF8_EUMVA|nr:hypothetical protein EVAR_47657_1 [Eumeta japonica]